MQIKNLSAQQAGGAVSSTISIPSAYAPIAGFYGNGHDPYIAIKVFPSGLVYVGYTRAAAVNDTNTVTAIYPIR